LNKVLFKAKGNLFFFTMQKSHREEKPSFHYYIALVQYSALNFCTYGKLKYAANE